MSYQEYRLHDRADDEYDIGWHLTAYTYPEGGVGMTVRARGAASIVVHPADLRAFAQWVLDTFPAAE